MYHSHLPQLLLLILAFSVATRSLYAQEVTSDEDDDDDEVMGGSLGSKPDADPFPKPQSRPRFSPPRVPDGVYYVQYFHGAGPLTAHGLTASQSKKESPGDASLAKYNGVWMVEVPASSAVDGDYALVMKSQARHYAVSARLSKPFAFDRVDQQFVLQYEVKFQNGIDCGGAYVKLLTDSPGLDLTNFNDKTPYTIMFGPDKCGTEHRLHFILRHRSPRTGQTDEKHAKKPMGDLTTLFSDKRTHLYTLVINSDNRFEIYVDQSLVNSGSLLEDLQPPVNPPNEIDDPSDKKPEHWDDRAKIQDPKVSKPDNWDEAQPEFVEDTEAVMPLGWLADEPLTVQDASAEKPKDWDDDMDGAWEPPRIANPRCKEAPGCGPWSRPKVKNLKYQGKWSPPLIDNPVYKGAWKPRRIPNPHHFVDDTPWRFDAIGAIGLELWTMSDGVAFDNLLIVDRKSLADAFAVQTWLPKREAERTTDSTAQTVLEALRNATHERPWIWAALLVGVVLPLVLLIAYCCCLRDSSTPSASVAAAARHKKTDADNEDETVEAEDEEELGLETLAEPFESKANLESDEEDVGQVQEAETEESDEPPELVDLNAPAAGSGEDSVLSSHTTGDVRKRASRME